MPVAPMNANMNINNSIISTIYRFIFFFNEYFSQLPLLWFSQCCKEAPWLPGGSTEPATSFSIF